MRRKAPGWRYEWCRSLCAERRLAGDARGAQKRQTKLKKKKKKKKKIRKKKLSAERRRLIESQEDERRKAPVHLALHQCSTLSEAFTSNQ